MVDIIERLMDPQPIGPAEWAQLGDMLTSLWFVVLFVVIFAANMIIGHNIIPSFVASGHIPNSWQRTRPAFYLVAIISIGLAAFFLIQVIDLASVLQGIWDNYWI